MRDISEREAERLELQRKFEDERIQSQRNKLGQFATPASLAAEIVCQAVSLLPHKSKIRFLEPGFGTGSFFSALLANKAKSRIQVADGYENDVEVASRAQQVWKGAGLRLYTCDFIAADPPKDERSKYNLVICNPPYVRHHHLEQAHKRQLQSAVYKYLNLEMNGLSGLYTYFLVLSQRWMCKNGIGAWLIPSEFMDVNYGRKVKEFLTEKVTLHRVHRFDPTQMQFGDALVSSAVLLFTNCAPPADHKVQFSFGGSIKQPKTSEAVQLGRLRHVAKWTGLTDASFNPQQSTEETLSTLFNIKRGLATGCNAFFVLSPEEAEQRKLPREFLRPILPSPRDLITNEILADENGEPIIRTRRYLLSCDLSEDEIKSRYPSLWEYLLTGVEKGIHERYLCQHREPWYCQEKRPPAPFLCTYMGRPSRDNLCPFRFILNHSKATVANVYLMLYPKPKLAEWLKADSDRYRQVWKALSAITTKMLVSEGRIYGGGLHKLEPKELANVKADGELNMFPAERQPTLFDDALD